MRTRNFPTALFAGLFLLGTATSGAAQTSAQEQDEHHPAETRATPPALPTLVTRPRPLHLEACPVWA